MRFSILALSSLVFLAGCPEEFGVEPAPAPVKPLRLESGSYGVVVTDVNEIDCEGMRTEDLFGMMLPLELQFGRGGQASGLLADLYVEGQQAGGVLSLAAVEPPIVVESSEGEDEETEVGVEAEEGSEDDADGEDAGAPPEPEEDCADGSDSSDGSEPRGGDCGDEGDDDVVVSPPPFEFGLELQASRRDHAEGLLSYRFQGCFLVLEVEAQRLERDDIKPMPGEDEPEPVEEEPVPGEECDDEDVDCG